MTKAGLLFATLLRLAKVWTVLVSAWHGLSCGWFPHHLIYWIITRPSVMFTGSPSLQRCTSCHTTSSVRA